MSEEALNNYCYFCETCEEYHCEKCVPPIYISNASKKFLTVCKGVEVKKCPQHGAYYCWHEVETE